MEIRRSSPGTHSVIGSIDCGPVVGEEDMKLRRCRLPPRARSTTLHIGRVDPALKRRRGKGPAATAPRARQ